MAIDENEETMGQRIAKLCEAKGLSQSDVARLLGVTRASVGQWWHDVSPNIRPANLITLAHILGTDERYLVHGKSRQPEGGFPTVPSPKPSPQGDSSPPVAFKSHFRRRST